jgi:serine/threonine protein kinase
MALSAGTRLGPYEIQAALGEGGMAEVYRARDMRLDRTVAIKVLLPHAADNPDARQRFDREARAISALQHPHICTLLDVGHQDGFDFLVMECLEGETLERRLLRGPLPLGDVLRYGAELADALDHAHRRGIVHRDIKPSNVMLTKTGAMLLDFGIVKWQASEVDGNADGSLSQTLSLPAEHALLGTLRYMASCTWRPLLMANNFCGSARSTRSMHGRSLERMAASSLSGRLTVASWRTSPMES